MCEPYLNHGYIIHMDNWYSSPAIFYDLLKAKTGACGTVKANRLSLPVGFSKIKLKEKGDSRTFTYGKEMQVIKIYDRKPVSLLSTEYSTTEIDHHEARNDVIL